MEIFKGKLLFRLMRPRYQWSRGRIWMSEVPKTFRNHFLIIIEKKKFFENVDFFRHHFGFFRFGSKGFPIVNYIGFSVGFFETPLPKKTEVPCKKSVLDALRVYRRWY